MNTDNGDEFLQNEFRNRPHPHLKLLSAMIRYTGPIRIELTMDGFF